MPNPPQRGLGLAPAPTSSPTTYPISTLIKIPYKLELPNCIHTQFRPLHTVGNVRTREWNTNKIHEMTSSQQKFYTYQIFYLILSFVTVTSTQNPLFFTTYFIPYTQNLQSMFSLILMYLVRFYSTYWS